MFDGAWFTSFNIIAAFKPPMVLKAKPMPFPADYLHY
jgi:hypothetical protein